MMVLRIYVWTIFLSLAPFLSVQGGRYEVSLDSCNVGQGLFSVLRCKNKETGDEELMIQDIGSTNYSKPFTYQEKQPPTPQRKEAPTKKKEGKEKKRKRKFPQKFRGKRRKVLAHLL